MVRRWVRSENTAVILAGFALTVFGGCDVQVRPVSTDLKASTANGSQGPERDSQLVELDRQLEGLQSELTSVDKSLSSDVATLRAEVSTKADKDEVRSLVQKELAKMEIRQRLSKVTTRTEELEKRLDALDEQFGILPRIRDAPWVESPKAQPKSSRD